MREIVIKLSDEEYEALQRASYYSFDKYTAYIAMKSGIVLPKGHGRLGDLDALEKEIINGIKAGNYEEGYEEYGNINNIDDCVECVKYADTIIKADEEMDSDEY